MDFNFKFSPNEFVDSLQYMGKGMLGIFIVIGIIVVCTFCLNKFAFFKRK